MSQIADIQDKLQDTHAAIARLEREVVKNPTLKSLRIDLQSLEKRRKQLEAEFQAASETIGVEVCTYRLLPEEGPVKLAGLARAIGEYQSIISLFYDALKHGPKRTGHVAADVTEEASLDFAYAFAGSVGFVFTVPTAKALWGVESALDTAMSEIVTVVKAQSPTDVRKQARKIGAAPIRALYKWAESHVKAQFSAEIEWRHGQTVRGQLLVQKSEFQRLQETIAATSDEEYSEFKVKGMLVGVDVKKGTFHLVPDGGADINGRLSEGIDESHPAPVPQRGRAKIGRRRKIQFAIDEEDTSFTLLEWKPAS